MTYSEMEHGTMARQVATPKQTAGGGFSFENKVCAYFAEWLKKVVASEKCHRAAIDHSDSDVDIEGIHIIHDNRRN